MFNLDTLIRSNIRSLIPYSSARDEYKGNDAIFLDANENPFNSAVNRYPDPQQVSLKQRIAEIKHVPPECIFLGNGSDEAIDLLIRAFCEPGKDNIISIQPTYGMYKVCADINGTEFREVLLKLPDYLVDTKAMINAADQHSKLMFLCSPNNPTANLLNRDDILYLITHFGGLVVLDEAYIDFSDSPSFCSDLHQFGNLIILHTFSKAWGMAGIRLGMAFASPEIIRLLNRIKYPYNINILTQRKALESLADTSQKDTWVKMIRQQRSLLQSRLEKTAGVKRILPSDANFLMIQFDNPIEVFRFLTDRRVIVRDRSKVALCHGFLRVTIGTKKENEAFMDALMACPYLNKPAGCK
jgi:histidinol-phosphate aminotransferase